LRTVASNGMAIDLKDIDPDGALATAASGDRGLSWAPGPSAPVVDLRDGAARPSPARQRRWDRILAGLRSRHRVEFRRTDGAAAAEALAAFNRLREERLRQLGRDFHDPPLPFLEAAVRKLAPSGRCALMEMSVDGTMVARDLYLLDGRTSMLWLRALDMSWSRYECGHLLLRESMARLAAEGYEALDLGRGGERYKFDAGAHERILLRARMEPGLQAAARGAAPQRLASTTGVTGLHPLLRGARNRRGTAPLGGGGGVEGP
jgi:CelD/BcsL family acetyltransferase involved in cellulose biosynthesis